MLWNKVQLNTMEGKDLVSTETVSILKTRDTGLERCLVVKSTGSLFQRIQVPLDSELPEVPTPGYLTAPFGFYVHTLYCVHVGKHP